MPEQLSGARARMYTRTGDGGMTSCHAACRVRKDDIRVETCGTLDELNSVIGVALVSSNLHSDIESILHCVQHDLFTLCAEIAHEGADGIPKVTESYVNALEAAIDDINCRVPPQHSFLLPGGCSAAAHLHLARTVCRRAERALVTLRSTHSVSDALLKYINRLSGLLYVLARFANHTAGVVEEAPKYNKHSNGI